MGKVFAHFQGGGFDIIRGRENTTQKHNKLMQPLMLGFCIFVVGLIAILVMILILDSRQRTTARNQFQPLRRPANDPMKKFTAFVEATRDIYHGTVPATDNQLEYIHILGGDPPPNLTMYEASRMIDNLIKKRDEQNIKHYEEERRYKRCKKEEDELKMLAAAEAETGYKPPRSRSLRVRTLREFQQLVNKVIADNVIEIEEVYDLYVWLKSNQTINGEFQDALRLMSRTLLAKKIDAEKSQQIYEALLDCLSQLRNRPSI